MTDPRMHDEAARLDSVRAYEEIGAPDQATFKTIALLIRDLIGAFDVGISMVRETEVRYYSCLLEKDPSVPREIAFSNHVVLQDEPLVVEDLALDERFKDNPFVRSSTHSTGFTMADGVSRPYRFYAGFQIRSLDGRCLGALYLLDIRPRTLDPLHFALLRKFAKTIESIMNLTMEMKLHQKDREALILSEKMSAIGRLTAGVAHEINTPIQFIGNNNHFLAEGFEAFNLCIEHLKSIPADFTQSEKTLGELPQFAESLKRFDIGYFQQEMSVALNQSAAGINRVSDLVNLLKTYAHSGGDAHSEANLNDVIHYATNITRYEWKSDIDVEVSLQENLPLVQCNSGQISQVMLNLITNAIDAIHERDSNQSDSRGAIKIRTYAQGPFATIEVEDNGTGISAEIMPRLFEPFFSTKDAHKGSGQGLAICWDIIVRRHRGELRVTSVPTEARTVFQINLPIQTV